MRMKMKNNGLAETILEEFDIELGIIPLSMIL